MGLMDWIKGKRSDAPASAEDRQKQAGAELAGLNFKKAIDAHMKWKIRLESCLTDGNKENLEVPVVASDSQCMLGKWIYSEGEATFGHLPEFREMKEEHARFHTYAGEVLHCCLSGDTAGASQKLQHGGAYGRSSEKVKRHLARLFVHAANQDN